MQKSSQKLPKFEGTISPDFKTVFATATFGGISPDDARITFFIDKVVTKTDEQGLLFIDKVVRETLFEVHMTPTHFKRVAIWMQGLVKQYESTLGEIVIPDEKQLTKLMKRAPKGATDK